MITLRNVGVDSQSHMFNFIKDHLQNREFIMNTWMTIAVLVILWAVGFFELPSIRRTNTITTSYRCNLNSSVAVDGKNHGNKLTTLFLTLYIWRSENDRSKI